MRNKLLAVAFTTVLTIGGTAVALAQAADTNLAHRQQMAEYDRTSGSSATHAHAYASATQGHPRGHNVARADQPVRHQPQG